MEISVVVPVKNEERSIGALLDSLARQTRIPDEVVVVDGGSVDRTPDLVESWATHHPAMSLRVVRVEDATPGRGRNIGIEVARNDWIALTDAGIELDDMWLCRLEQAAMSAPEARIVYGNMEPVVLTPFHESAVIAYVPPRVRRECGWMRGPVIPSTLVHRSVWTAVGGFPDLRASEDLIFIERVEASGFRAAWACDATARWRLQDDLVSTFRRFRLYSRHNVLAGRQHSWHYGLARQYVVVALCIVLSVAWSGWWLVGLPLWLSARCLKSFWVRRRDRSFLDHRTAERFLRVMLMLLSVDLATLMGWLDAGRRSAGRRG